MSATYASFETMAHTVEGLQIVIQAELLSMQDGRTGRTQTDQERLLHTMLSQVLARLVTAGHGLALAATVGGMDDARARHVLAASLAAVGHD